MHSLIHSLCTFCLCYARRALHYRMANVFYCLHTGKWKECKVSGKVVAVCSPKMPFCRSFPLSTGHLVCPFGQFQYLLDLSQDNGQQTMGKLTKNKHTKVLCQRKECICGMYTACQSIKHKSQQNCGLISRLNVVVCTLCTFPYRIDWVLNERLPFAGAYVTELVVGMSIADDITDLWQCLCLTCPQLTAVTAKGLYLLPSDCLGKCCCIMKTVHLLSGHKTTGKEDYCRSFKVGKNERKWHQN